MSLGYYWSWLVFHIVVHRVQVRQVVGRGGLFSTLSPPARLWSTMDGRQTEYWSKGSWSFLFTLWIFVKGTQMSRGESSTPFFLDEASWYIFMSFSSSNESHFSSPSQKEKQGSKKKSWVIPCKKEGFLFSLSILAQKLSVEQEWERTGINLVSGSVVVSYSCVAFGNENYGEIWKTYRQDIVERVSVYASTTTEKKNH